jgi:DNA-binding PadR family transcriptional regulator
MRDVFGPSDLSSETQARWLTNKVNYTIISPYDISWSDSMSIDSPDPKQLIPLTPAAFHILLALTDGEKHGYAIMQAIALRSGGEVRMGPGTLYGLIKRMLTDGWIEELDERPDPALDDERRRYYRLSNLGQRVASAEAERLALLVAAARQQGLLPSKDHAILLLCSA